MQQVKEHHVSSNLEMRVCLGHDILVNPVQMEETDDIFCYILEHNINYSIAKFTFISYQKL